MYRRKDSDIFGAKVAPIAPRINNDENCDPNEVFQLEVSNKYSMYCSTVKNKFKIAKKQDQKSQNETINLAYHRNRKYLDMQSSIFYPPKHYERKDFGQQSQQSLGSQIKQNHGRKQILLRENKIINKQRNGIKGNGSTLFGFAPDTQNIKHSIIPLVPYEMNWDQYDSIRYEGNSNHINKNHHHNIIQHPQIKSQKCLKNKIQKQLENIKDKSKSIVEFQERVKCENEGLDDLNKQNKPQCKSNKQSIHGSKKQKFQKDNSNVVVEVKGWKSKYLQQLSKYCQINGTTVQSMSFQGGKNGQIQLKRSGRWENVTDWLRKDAKMTIRIHKQ